MELQEKTKTRILRNHNDHSTITVNNISNTESSKINVKQEISECNQNSQIKERLTLNIKKGSILNI